MSVLTFTETTVPLKVLIARWPSACLVISVQWKCSCLLASGRLHGSKRLLDVVSALNKGVTRLTGKKVVDAIKEKVVSAKLPTPYSRPVGVNEKKLVSNVNVCYLYQLGELEGGTKRAIDPIWSLDVHKLERTVTKPNEPVIYYMHDGPKRGLVREELLVVPPDTQLPLAYVV